MIEYLNKEYPVESLFFLRGIELIGDPKAKFSSVSNLEDIKPGSLVYIENQKYQDHVNNSEASVIVCSKEIADEKFIEKIKKSNQNLIIFPNPKAVFAFATSFFKKRTVQKGVQGKFCIIPKIDLSNVELGNHVIIEEGVKVGKNVFIGSGCYIGQNSIIGDNTYLYPNVTILENCYIGENCIIHSQTVIGSDGFGYQFHDMRHNKIEQLGGVEIGNFVEIGSNCSIDRGTINNTVIADGCKIDNLCQIAHNVIIDAGTVIAAQTGIAGGAKIGKFVFLGGQVGVADHAVVEDQVMIGAKTGLSKTTYKAGKTYIGYPAMESHDFKRMVVGLKHIYEMWNKVSAFEKQVQSFTDKDSNSKNP